MRRPMAVVAMTFALTHAGLTFSIGLCANAGESRAMEKYQLPDDPKATVISLDYQGGYTPPQTGHQPTMSISADGSVKIPANYQGQKAFQGKLEPGELQALLRFVIAGNDFFDYDPQAVKKKLAQDGLQLRIADAATTIITVNANGKSKEVRHYALGFGRNAAVAELEQLLAVKNRLEQVRSTVQLGGKKAVEKWLKLANGELQAKHPQVAPLATDDLQSGGERADGSVYVSFLRRLPAADGNPASAGQTNVFINKPAKGEMQVNVSHRPAK